MDIAIIGCGNMGSAFAKQLGKDHQLFLYDHNLDKAEALSSYGKVCKTMKDAAKKAEVVMLAIKPQSLAEAEKELASALKSGQLLMSLLTGIKLKTLKSMFPKCKVVRVMPNIAILCGEGLIGLCTDEGFDPKIKEEVTDLCAPLGKGMWIPESKMDAFTALAGSGPAFVFAMMEAMVDAGIAMGFSAHEAQDIVQQMIKGSMLLVDKTEKHPGELKWQVTSPQGTTIAGLKKLEEQATRGSIINTFLAAYERAKQLSNPS